MSKQNLFRAVVFFAALAVTFALSLGWLAQSRPLLAAPNACTHTVINTHATGTGSLRQAILNVNGCGGGTINFNIPGSGIQTINLTATLPFVNKATLIDGRAAVVTVGRLACALN
jgi:hypothetical protein